MLSDSAVPLPEQRIVDTGGSFRQDTVDGIDEQCKGPLRNLKRCTSLSACSDAFLTFEGGNILSDHQER